MTVLRLEDVSKHYGHTTAVADLCLSVEVGEIYGLLGPNGAGKTTTMQMVAGLVAPTRGKVVVAGRQVVVGPGPGGRVGAMIEEPAFPPHLSGRDCLRSLAHRAHVLPARAEELLALVGLEGRADDRYRTWSMGMRQRLGLAAALLARPDVLVLDEPANGLDPAAMGALRATLRDVAARGCAVLLSSHLLGEVDQVCDRLGVMVAGRLVTETTVAALHRQGRLVVDGQPLDRARRAVTGVVGSDAVSLRGTHLDVAIDPDEVPGVNRALVRAGVDVRRLAWCRPDLEDLYLDLTGGTRDVA